MRNFFLVFIFTMPLLFQACATNKEQINKQKTEDHFTDGEEAVWYDFTKNDDDSDDTFATVPPHHGAP